MGATPVGYVTGMAEAEPKRATSTVFIVAGLLLSIVVIAAAFIADPDYGWPVLILVVITLAAALGYRAITNQGRPADDSDSTDNIPRQEPRGERPLGDTPEAHDEISPHDLPPDHPGRKKAEEQAAEHGGTTRGDV